ncbi:lipase family protein [Pelagicoccus sp. SDUM812002]|uniref:lipase family protein n=1 Tax=Pelagicoccus sp. SDUM812002 TaxID=3041266 RepID=UPI00280E78A2|nr:lipase family protein [Pelagicoccus sp. SDUM812002]MDQ8184364.1 lipase family protein [Pelagicoccus sp. SDUM812002]
MRHLLILFRTATVSVLLPITPMHLAKQFLALCMLAPVLIGTTFGQALSHKSLFAPNTTFSYFESCDKLEESDPADFSFQSAGYLAQCSFLIYVKEESFIENSLAKAGFPETQFFDESGTYAFLTKNEEHVVISFRGTESGDHADYFTDAKFKQAPFTENGTAHGGFIEALAQIEEDLQDSLKRSLEENRNKTVWVTGHSMGGALATLFSIHNMDSVDALYTFGAPRLVGQKLAQHLQDELPIFRVVNNNDFVCRIPSQPFYKHIGPTFFLTSDKVMIVDPPFTKAWKERLKGHRKFTKRLISEHWLENDFSAIPSDYFVDHSPRLYAEILIDLSKEETR